MLKKGMRPAHPGEILKYDCMEPLGLTVTELAEGLHVTRQTISKIINGKSRLTPEMALKLSEAFGTSVEVWLGVQQDYDLWQAEQKRDKTPVKRYYTTHQPAV